MLLQTYRWQARFQWSAFVRTLVWVPLAIVIVAASYIGTCKVFPVINPVQVEFFEQSDVDFVVVEIENPEGTTKETTDIAVRRVEDVLYGLDYIESFTVTVGSGSQFGNGGSGEKFANIFISLTDDRILDSTAIVEDLRAQVSPLRDLKISVNQPTNGPPTGAAIVVKFLGDDLAEITKLANSASLVLQSIPNTVNVETSTNNNSTEFVLELDRDKAASLGLSPTQVSQIARTAVFGTEATTLTTLTEDIAVVVKLNVANSETVNAENADNISIDSLQQILIPTQSGTAPLSELVAISLRESSSVINHEGGKRVVSLSADVSAAGNAREVQAQALAAINEQLDIPTGVEISTGGGESEDSNQAFAEMLLALAVGVTLMIGVLTLQFNSYLHTRYVLSILPYSLIGIFIGLAVTMNPLSFPSIMGFIALSGIVVNNSILLIDMMNQIRRNKPEQPIKEVVLDAAGNRLRPILLTTATTVIGMVPLTYAGDLWAPLAYAVMFGLVFSVVITLILIPILYSRNPGTLDS
jgi:HAE1 family hydrophobic/amphiphilic exporter-1